MEADGTGAESDPPTGQLAAAWRQVARPFANFRTQMYDVSKQLGISPAAVSALLSLDPDDPRPMRELAALLDCDASYVTGLVDDLEKAGLARRQPSAQDRRAKTIHLTANGVSARAAAEAALLGPPPALSRLSNKDQRSLARLLRRANELAQPQQGRAGDALPTDSSAPRPAPDKAGPAPD